MTHPARRQQHTGTDLVPVEAAVDGRDLALVHDLEWADEDWEAIEAAARTRRAPYVMGAVTAGVGASAWGCAQVAGWMAGPDGASTVETVTWMATAVSVPLLRSMFRHRIPEAWRTRWWLSTAAAAAWVDVAVAKGADLLDPASAGGMLATLLLGGVVLGSRWSDECEILGELEDVDDPEPEPLPVLAVPRLPEIDTSRAKEIEDDWESRVADGANPIARGSQLLHRTHLPHGYRWLVQLDRDGSVGATSLITDSTLAGVALRLGLRATHVILERLEGDDDREDRGLLTIVTTDVLAKGVPYDGPNYDRGIIRIGRYADGTGDARWEAYDRTGVRCGIVTGEQGSGKSGLLAALGMAYRRSGEWIVLFGDGDDKGGSSRLLGSVAHDFARGPQEVLEQLEGLEALGRVRGDLMRTLTGGPNGKPVAISRPGQRAVDKILPCPAYPGIVWILDEFHKLAQDPDLKAVNFVGRVAKIVRLLRKYGGSVILGTQSALGGDFGGDSAFRAMVASGNNMTMRSGNKSERGVVGDGVFNPGSLPKGGGYGFLDDGARLAMIRVFYSEDMHTWADEVTAFGTPDERSWNAFRRYRQVREFDVVADYLEGAKALEAFDAAVASDAPLPGSPEEKAASEAAEREAKKAEAGEQVAASAVAPMSFGGFTIPTGASNVVPIRRDVGEQPQAEAEPAQLSDKALRVLAMLRTHPEPRTTAQLEHATGLSKPDASKALGELVRAGLACRPTGKQGVYAATSISVQKESS